VAVANVTVSGRNLYMFIVDSDSGTLAATVLISPGSCFFLPPGMTTPNSFPSPETLAQASILNVVDLEGVKIPFGALFHSQKVIIVFIR
jgi:hypothetical protein